MKRPQLALTLALLLTPAAVPAQPAPHSGEDCEVLAKLVKKHVYLAATRISMAQSGGTTLRLADIGEPTRHLCRRTVEFTTRSFGEALAALNQPIGWQPPHPDGYCLGDDLSRCYPGPRIGVRVLSAARLAFVYDAWAGVRDAVQSQVAAGSGGAAVFSADSLDAALKSHLAASVEGPLWRRYVVR